MKPLFYFRSDNVLLNTVITRFFYLRVLFGPLQSTVDYSVFEDYPVLDLLWITNIFSQSELHSAGCF